MSDQELLMQGDKTAEPTTANYTFKHIMEVQNTTYEIDLGPSQLREVSFLPLCPNTPRLVPGHLLVVNPVLSCVHARSCSR